MVIDGQDHAAPAGTFVRLDPEPQRTVVNRSDARRDGPDRVRAADERLHTAGLGMNAAVRSGPCSNRRNPLPFEN